MVTTMGFLTVSETNPHRTKLKGRDPNLFFRESPYVLDNNAGKEKTTHPRRINPFRMGTNAFKLLKEKRKHTNAILETRYCEYGGIHHNNNRGRGSSSSFDSIGQIGPGGGKHSGTIRRNSTAPTRSNGNTRRNNNNNNNINNNNNNNNNPKQRSKSRSKSQSLCNVELLGELMDFTFNLSDYADEIDVVIKYCVAIFKGTNCLPPSVHHDDIGQFVKLVQVTYETERHNKTHNSKLPLYHNFARALNVVQATTWILQNTAAMNLLSGYSKLSVLLASFFIDIGHGGWDTCFLHLTNNSLLRRHESLKEYHATIARNLLEQKLDFMLDMIPAATKVKIINDLEELILATDISEHTVNLDTLRSFANKGHYQTAFVRKIQDKKRTKGVIDSEPLPDPERIILLTGILKMADSMHAVKGWETGRAWFENELMELQEQGLEEKRRMMPASTMTEVSSLKSMVSGLIDCNIMPMAETLALALPNTDVLVHKLCENREIWELYYESNTIFNKRGGTLENMSRLRNKIEKQRREEEGIADFSFTNLDLSDKVPLFVNRVPSNRAR